MALYETFQLIYSLMTTTEKLENYIKYSRLTLCVSDRAQCDEEQSSVDRLSNATTQKLPTHSECRDSRCVLSDRSYSSDMV